MKLAGNGLRERILASAARQAEGDIVRRGILMHTIRHLELEWRDRPREAGKLCVYGFRGSVMDGIREVSADIFIGHDSWSGALVTSVTEVTAGSSVAADFIGQIYKIFPVEYYPFLENAHLVSSGVDVDIKTLTPELTGKNELTRQEIVDQIEDRWVSNYIGPLGHGEVRTPVEIRRLLAEWQRRHNCQIDRDPETQSRGGVSSSNQAVEAKRLVRNITLPIALGDGRSMHKLTAATKPFTPARRIEIAIASHQRKKGSDEKFLTLEHITKKMHVSKAPQEKERKLQNNGSKASEKLIGMALTCMREKYFETQKETANFLGVQQQKISYLERNPFTAGRELIAKFCELYGEDINDIEEMRFMNDATVNDKLIKMETDRKDDKRKHYSKDSELERINTMLQVSVILPANT